MDSRPLSVPFIIRTSGKGTYTATTLELEKYRRIDFSLGKSHHPSEKSILSNFSSPRGVAILGYEFSFQILDLVSNFDN